ncbi:hypothetical protein QR680_016600 [Steinernema hermaphroditum]|uniref:Peptidase S54 rhomboid domain-containing protein n=1 Tax=Steinernema hermaphroditum TaxID=289476 RepID=A0AA39HE62_9BILA|nr:hypothetical protein QR680_016600 [Steinernema hermaphroditum]
MPVKIDIPDEDLYLMDQEDRQERTIHHSDNIACAIQLTDDDEHPQRTESAMFGTSLINTINDTPYTALKEIWKISIGCILQYSPIITAHFVLLLFAIHRDDQFPSDMLVLDAVDTEYYQLFTYALVHNSESHLYANVAVLFVTGWVTEVSYGRLTLVLLMGISAGGGGIFFRFSHMVFEGASLVAGASGIVYGLVTFGIVQSFLRRPFPLDAKKIAFYAYGAILLLVTISRGTRRPTPRTSEAPYLACFLSSSFGIWTRFVANKKSKKTNENINARLSMVVKSSKYTLGYKQVIKSLLNGKSQMLIVVFLAFKSSSEQ